jgi:flagellar assembly protein FliH
MNATKFTFDTVFGTERNRRREHAAAKQRRVYTEAEVEILVSAAREQGASEGESRAAELLTEVTRDAARAMRETFERAAQEMEALRAESSALVFALAHKLAGAALDSYPEREVERALREAMHQAMGEPRIVLRAAPDVADILGPRIADIAHEEGYEGRVQLSADAALNHADCRIEWRGGGAERAQAAIAAALQEVITRRFQGASRDAEG